DSFVVDKPEAVRLAGDLGLAGDLVSTNARFRRTLVVRDGELVPLPEAFQLMAPGRILPFLASPILSWRGKLRVMADLVVPRGAPPPDGDESLASFVRRRLGQEALERIAQPMVGGIYTADPETLSLASTMPRFLDLERRHRSLILGLMREARRAQASGSGAGSGTSGARFGLFASLQRGIGSLVEALVDRLPPGSVRTGARAVSIARTGASGGEAPWRVELADGATLAADAVVVALPAPRAAELLRAADPPLADELAGIACASAAIVNLAYRRADVPRPLEAFGVVVPDVERRQIVACSFSSVKFAGRAPEDRILLRAFVGGALRPEPFALDDAALVASVRDELRSLLGIAAEPLLTRLHRWPESMPQYRVGHARRVARIRERVARLPGIALAGSAYEGVGLSDCVRSGERAAATVLADLGLEGVAETVGRSDRAPASDPSAIATAAEPAA